MSGKRKACWLEMGAILAANFVFRDHGEDVIAFGILEQIQAEGIDPMSIDAADRKVLRAYQKELRERSRLEKNIQ